MLELVCLSQAQAARGCSYALSIDSRMAFYVNEMQVLLNVSFRETAQQTEKKEYVAENSG